MKKALIPLVIFLVAALTVFTTGQKEEVTKSPVSIKALTIGPGPVPVTRAQNLETAAEQLKAGGIDLKYEVIFSTQKFEPYRTSFSLAYSSGDVADILAKIRTSSLNMRKRG